jgi:hypothetical protein
VNDQYRVVFRAEDHDADRLGEYDGDIKAMWPYARALRTFQVEGDDERSRAALRRALRVNPHVLRYLLDPGAIPPDAPPHFALGTREEGAYVAESLTRAFVATPGALSWLQTVGIGEVLRRSSTSARETFTPALIRSVDERAIRPGTDTSHTCGASGATFGRRRRFTAPVKSLAAIPVLIAR